MLADFSIGTSFPPVGIRTDRQRMTLDLEYTGLMGLQALPKRCRLQASCRWIRNRRNFHVSDIIERLEFLKVVSHGHKPTLMHANVEVNEQNRQIESNNLKAKQRFQTKASSFISENENHTIACEERLVRTKCNRPFSTTPCRHSHIQLQILKRRHTNG